MSTGLMSIYGFYEYVRMQNQCHFFSIISQANEYHSARCHINLICCFQVKSYSVSVLYPVKWLKLKSHARLSVSCGKFKT